MKLKLFLLGRGVGPVEPGEREERVGDAGGENWHNGMFVGMGISSGPSGCTQGRNILRGKTSITKGPGPAKQRRKESKLGGCAGDNY